MECEKCGKELSPSSAFCSACGEPTAKKRSEQAPEAAAAEVKASEPTGAMAPPGLPVPPGAPVQGGPVPPGAAPSGAPAPPGAPVLPGPPVAPPKPVARTGPRTSGWAIASLVMGILGWTCLFFIGSVLAIVFGAVARHQIKKSQGQLRGNGLANAGLVLGIVLVALMVIGTAVFLPLSYFRVGPTRTTTRTVELGNATSVRSNLDMHNGSLVVGGGASELMSGKFTYNISDWRPEVSYSVVDGQGRLGVRQPGDWHWTFWTTRNDWDIHFKDGVPLDLSANLTAGSSHFNLSSLDIAGLNADSSAGSITADLSGQKPSLKNVSLKTNAGHVSLILDGVYQQPLQLSMGSDAGSVDLSLLGTWNASLTGTVDVSAGNVTIKLPGDVGVLVNAKSSFGDVDTRGLKRGTSSDSYVNEAYGKTAVTIELNVRSSAGTVRLDVMQ